MTQDTHREPYSPNTPQARLETIQALVLLFAVGLWGAKAILHEAISLQSQVALLVREEGLDTESSHQQPNHQQPTPDWETWARMESAKRTKLIAYCFLNLCSIAYDTPPLLLTSELHLPLPSPSRLWKAETAWQWQEMRQSYQPAEVLLQDAFSRLLNRPSQGSPSPLTSLGYYVLIHALIQHIFMLKQTSFASISPFEISRGLKMEDVEDVTQALKIWTLGFEQHIARQSEGGQHGNGDSSPEGPIALNSSALLRLAYIRLYTELKPSRSLDSRDHVLIASAFSDADLLVRTPRLFRPVAGAIFALSHLVKLGVSYVAKTKSPEWGVQHSLCNLECAVLLSKWLLTLAAIGPAEPPPSADEKQLLQMITHMLDETEFAVPIDPSLSGSGGNHGHHQSRPAMDVNAADSTKLRQLASAVVRLWAETFKGAHIFEVIAIMAAGLEGYADLIEKPRDRTPIGRMVSN